MAGIGDSWGTEEELLHPRGPDGRWIRSGGIAKSLISKVLDFLANFRPRTFQNQHQANQYLQNIASRQGRRRMGRMDHIRLRQDLPSANADLRDGVIDEPSTKRFVDMMDRSATELPDDTILARVVGVDAFGFTPETAKGTNSDTDPGIRGMSGKLVADRGYGLHVIGDIEAQAPAGTVRMVVAAKKGTRVIVPSAGPSDSTILTDRGQPLRVTKIRPDASGGWTMFVTAESHDAKDVPEPIGGPIGEGRKSSKEREAGIRESMQRLARFEKQPNEQEEQADIERRRQAAEEAARTPAVPSPAQQAEEQRVAQLPRQPAPGEPPPRTEPVVGRVGEGPATGNVPAAPGAGAPEPTAPSGRTVDLRQAVKAANIPSPSAGSRRRQWNEAYLGVASGKKDPIDAVRELDSDIKVLRGGGEPGGGLRRGREEDREADIAAFQGLRDLIAREYGLEETPPGKREKRTAAGLPKAERPQPTVTRLSKREQEAQARNAEAAKKAAKKAPAKKAAKKAAPGGMTPAQEEAVIARAREFRGAERNDEERRIVGEADRILAERRAPEVQATKALRAPAKKASATKKALPPVKKTAAKKAAPSTEDRVAVHLLDRMNPEMRDRIMADMPEEDRRTVEEAVQRVRKAGPPGKKAPAKKIAKKAPANLPAPEAEAPGDLDQMTKAELLAEAERRGVEVPKSWNKDKIKALMREEETRFPRKKTPAQRLEQERADQAISDEMDRIDAQQAAEKAAKKAAPEAPGDDLDRMTKPELLALAKREGVQRTSSMNKDQLKSGIKRMREIGPVEPGSAVDTENRIQDLLGIDRKPTVADLRAFAKKHDIAVGPRDRRSDLVSTLLTLAPDRMRGGAPEAEAPGDVKAEVKRLRDHARVTRELGGMRLANNPPGSYHHNRGQRDLEEADRLEAEADALERGAPKAPAPVKKAAKAAVPGAAPGTAAGKITAGRLQPGMRVLVGRNEEGDYWFPSTRKTGQTAITIDRFDRISVRNGRRTTNRLVLVGHDDKGNEIRVEGDPRFTRGVPSHQTFIVAPEPGAAPAKKAAKAAAPDLEEAARTRQGKIDRARGYGNLGTEIEELVSHDASEQALKARVRSRAKREGIPDAEIQPLLEAIEGPDRDQVGVEAQRLTDREGVVHIGHAGDTVAFDPAIHQGQGGGKFKKGDLVQVVRPGHRARVGDEDVQLAKATVEEPDRPGGKGPDLVPEGSVAGPRATAPVGNAPRRRELRQAWISADLPTPPPGSGRKSQEEIKGDVLAGRITPEEGIRRFESEVAFGKEDLAEVDAHLRETDLSPEERGKVERHRANLQATIESHEKQSTFLRDYFKDEAPVVSIKELKDVDPESFEFLKDATPDDMRTAAKEAGLDPPSGDTPDEMFRDLIKQVARNELARRAAKKAAKKAPAKKLAKAAPEVPKERERIDARLVGAGLDFDENDPWVKRTLDNTQKDLDTGDKTPAAIGRELDEAATSRMTTAVYEHGSWLSEDRPWQSPEETARIKAENQANYDRVKAETNKVRELGARLQKTRRKPVKKAAPAKLAPEIRSRDQQIDDLQKRIVDNALKEMSEAKTRDKADDALEGLTMADLRRLADGAGIKAPRSKRALRDAILDRFKGTEVPPEPPTPGASKSLAIRAREAGIPSPDFQTFEGVDSAVGDADRRLKGGESPTSVAKFLRERATTVSKANLDEEDRRLKVSVDRDTLRVRRKLSAEYLRRVATHVQQEGKAAPAKKAPAKKAPGRDLGAELQLLTRGTTVEERPGMRPPAKKAAPTTQAERAARLQVIRGEGKGGGRAVSPPEGSRRLTVVPPAKATAPAGKPEGAPFSSRLRRELTDGSGRIRPRERPGNDEPVYLPNRGNDQGRVHMDSELGELWSDLYLDDREPNSFINEIARIGEQVGTGQLPLAQALERLARMKGRATDKAVEARIQRAIDAMDSPKVKVPDLPDTVPASIKEALRRLAEIPTARSTKVRGIRPGEKSVFEQKLDIIRRLDAGDEERRLDAMLRERDLHESVDGALEMWRLFENIDMRELMKWRREAHRRAHPEQYSAFALVPV